MTEFDRRQRERGDASLRCAMSCKAPPEVRPNDQVVEIGRQIAI
jgi:hypothetical protein